MQDLKTEAQARPTNRPKQRPGSDIEDYRSEMMKVEHDSNLDIMYIYLYEWMRDEDPAPYEVAETFELAEGINVDVNEAGDALGLEVESTESLKAWIEAPIKHRMKLERRIRREDPPTWATMEH